MTLVLLLFASITMTLPERAAYWNECGPHASRPANLESLFIYAEVPPAPARILRVMDVRGWEGATWYVGLTSLGDSFATLWARTSNDSGMLSCESNRVRLNAPATAASASEAPPRVTYFDVAGRRLPGRPGHPGIYFARTGRSRAARVVVIR